MIESDKLNLLFKHTKLMKDSNRLAFKIYKSKYYPLVDVTLAILFAAQLLSTLSAGILIILSFADMFSDFKWIFGLLGLVFLISVTYSAINKKVEKDFNKFLFNRRNEYREKAERNQRSS